MRQGRTKGRRRRGRRGAPGKKGERELDKEKSNAIGKNKKEATQ